jgi:hypothetical protein
MIAQLSALNSIIQVVLNKVLEEPPSWLSHPLARIVCCYANVDASGLNSEALDKTALNHNA